MIVRVCAWLVQHRNQNKQNKPKICTCNTATSVYHCPFSHIKCSLWCGKLSYCHRRNLQQTGIFVWTRFMSISFIENNLYFVYIFSFWGIFWEYFRERYKINCGRWLISCTVRSKYYNNTHENRTSAHEYSQVALKQIVDSDLHENPARSRIHQVSCWYDMIGR